MVLAAFDDLIELVCSFLSFWIIGLIRLANFVNTGIFQNKPLFDPNEDGDSTNDDPSSPNYDPNPRPDPFSEFTNGCILTIDIVSWAIVVITGIILIMYLIKPIYIITKMVGITRSLAQVYRQRLNYATRRDIIHYKVDAELTLQEAKKIRTGANQAVRSMTHKD